MFLSFIHLLVGSRARLEADPDTFVGGTLGLPRQEFRSAALTTLEGNNYFIVTVEFQSRTVVIQDDASGVW